MQQGNALRAEAMGERGIGTELNVTV
jgi:hypothetical protein